MITTTIAIKTALITTMITTTITTTTIYTVYDLPASPTALLGHRVY